MSKEKLEKLNEIRLEIESIETQIKFLDNNLYNREKNVSTTGTLSRRLMILNLKEFSNDGE